MSPRHQDLIRLTLLAREANRDVAPTLLRVQADLFADAPSRDRPTVAAFEALALAMLPRADAETASYVAGRVAHLRETPDSVRSLLPSGDCVDAGRAQGRALQAMVDRARGDRELAATLLARDDLPAEEAARLYLHADAARRSGLRTALASSGALARNRLMRPDPRTLDELLACAARADAASFGARLSRALGVVGAQPDWRPRNEARRELLALGLVALGAPEEVCVRIFLTLDAVTARSVEAVFGLVEIVRRTPRSVALRIVEAALGLDLAIEAATAESRVSQAATENAPGRGRKTPAERAADAPTPRQALAAAAGALRDRAVS